MSSSSNWIVPYNPPSAIPYSASSNEQDPPRWPNDATFQSSLLLTVHTITHLYDIPHPMGPIMHLPIRAWMLSHALKKKNYAHIALNILAFSALFLPKGKIISAVIDVSGELLNLYKIGFRNITSPFPKPKVIHRFNLDKWFHFKDPTVLENAFYILGVKETATFAEVKRSYTKRQENMAEKYKTWSTGLKPFVIQKMQNIDEAYKTLKRHYGVE